MILAHAPHAEQVQVVPDVDEAPAGRQADAIDKPALHQPGHDEQGRPDHHERDRSSQPGRGGQQHEAHRHGDRESVGEDAQQEAKVVVVVAPTVHEAVLEEQQNRRHGGHAIDQQGDREAFAREVMPAADRLGEVKRQAVVLEIVADQHRTGKGQDHDGDVPLGPDEVAVGVRGAVEVHRVAQGPDQDVGGDHPAEDAAGSDKRLLHPVFQEHPEILAEEIEKENQNAEGVHDPKEFPPGEQDHAGAGDGPDAAPRAAGGALKDSVMQQVGGHVDPVGWKIANGAGITPARSGWPWRRRRRGRSSETAWAAPRRCPVPSGSPRVRRRRSRC